MSRAMAVAEERQGKDSQLVCSQMCLLPPLQSVLAEDVRGAAGLTLRGPST